MTASTLPANTPNAGKFIAFEGVDGSGKSTVIRLVADRLRQRGIDVITTREPGGSSGAEQIRALLVAGDTGRWSPMAELLLHAAARAEHVEAVIRPALAAGQWVLTDRYVGSTMAYQGFGMGQGRDLVIQIHKLTCGLLPDITVLLDVPPAVAAARLGGRDGLCPLLHHPARAPTSSTGSTGPNRRPSCCCPCCSCWSLSLSGWAGVRWLPADAYQGRVAGASPPAWVVPVVGDRPLPSKSQIQDGDPKITKTQKPGSIGFGRPNIILDKLKRQNPQSQNPKTNTRKRTTTEKPLETRAHTTISLV